MGQNVLSQNPSLIQNETLTENPPTDCHSTIATPGSNPLIVTTRQLTEQDNYSFIQDEFSPSSALHTQLQILLQQLVP